jgi:hypothetical protein
MRMHYIAVQIDIDHASTDDDIETKTAMDGILAPTQTINKAGFQKH